MAILNKTLDESTPEERRLFVKNFLNLEVPDDASDDDILAAINRAQPSATSIFVQNFEPQPDEPQPGVHPADAPPLTTEQEAAKAKLNLRPEEQGRPQAGSLGRNDPKAVIEIPIVETDDETGAQDVLVGVNGIAWQLKRGIPIPVPWRVVEALILTIGTSITHKNMPDGEVDEIRTDTKRFPFHFHEKPTDEAIAAWHAQTDEMFNP